MSEQLSSKPRLLMIDGLGVIIAQNSLPAVNAIVDHNTYPIGVYLTTMNLIRIWTEKFKPTKIIFNLDGPEAGERRRQIYPDYKNGRIIKKRESKVEIMEGEDNIVYGVEGAYQNQMIKIFEFIKLLPITMLMVPYAEADDVIANMALKNKDEFDVIIIANDRDYLQLIQPGIFVYRWREKKLYGIKEIEDEFKIKPSNFIFRKIMLGDKGDKVKGIKGVGEDTFNCFNSMLLENECKDIKEFLELIKSLKTDEFKTREKNAIAKTLLLEDDMNLAYALMKLDENSINEEQREIVKIQLEEQKINKLSLMAAKVKMFKTSFGKLYRNFNDDVWLSSFKFVKNHLPLKY